MDSIRTFRSNLLKFDVIHLLRNFNLVRGPHIERANGSKFEKSSHRGFTVYIDYLSGAYRVCHAYHVRLIIIII